MHAASTSLLRRSHSARMEPWDVQAPRSPLAAVRRVIDSATPPPAPTLQCAPWGRSHLPKLHCTARQGSEHMVECSLIDIAPQGDCNVPYRTFRGIVMFS